MADTSTPNLDLIYMQVGAPNREILYNNLSSIVDSTVAGVLALDLAGSGDYTLTDTITGEAKYGCLRLTGVLTGARNLLVPDKGRRYLVENATTGAFTLTVKTATGAGVTLDQDTWGLLVCDGTDVVATITGGAGGTLPVASETVAGIVELATQTETDTGIDDARAVTPLKLATRLAALPAASDTTPGLVELATGTETTTGTDTQRAVTPASLAAKLPSGTPLSVTRYAASGQTLEATPGFSTASDGRLGVGVAPDASTALTVQGIVRVRQGNLSMARDDGNNPEMQGAIYTDTVARQYTVIGFRAGGSESSPTATQANMPLLRLGGRVHDGTSFPPQLPAWIDLTIDEAVTSTTRGSRITLNVTRKGTTTQVEALRIDSQANLTTGGAVAGTSMQGGLVVKSGTAPSAAHPADAVQAWVADRNATAGKASLYLRVEDGTPHVLGDLSGIGTPLTATLGSGASYQALSVAGSLLTVGASSVQERPQTLLSSTWVVSTDATRTARLTLSAYDATAAREGLRVEADGSAARLGFFGATAVVRPTLAAAATDAATTQTLANSLRTALLSLGLCA